MRQDGSNESLDNSQNRKFLLSSQNLIGDLWGLKSVRPSPKVSEYVLENVGAAVSFPKASTAHSDRYNRFYEQLQRMDTSSCEHDDEDDGMNYDNDGMTSGLRATYQDQEEYEQCQEENEAYL